MGSRPNSPLSGRFNSPPAHVLNGGDVAGTAPPRGQHESPETPAPAGANRLGDSATGRYGVGNGLDLTSERRPFLTATRAYIEDVRPYYRDGTLQRVARDLRVIEADLRTLKRDRKIASTNPQLLSEADVGQLVLWWKTRPSRYGRPLNPTSQRHLLSALGNLLGWCGNPVLDVMRRRKHVRFPKELKKPIATLGPQDLERLRRAAETIPAWRGSVARFLVAFMPATGLRPKELRLARMEDLDLERWTLAVEHPKGEDTWAPSGIEAPVLPFAQQAVMDYLDERRAFLGSEDHEALIPFRHSDGAVSYWSEPMLRKLKAELARTSGVRFHLKTFRATFAQVAKDRGASIEAVSRGLRHSSTKVTEGWYARIRAASAFDELRRVFDTPEVKDAEYPSDE